jgi:hypothetical protein
MIDEGSHAYVYAKVEESSCYRKFHCNEASVYNTHHLSPSRTALAISNWSLLLFYFFPFQLTVSREWALDDKDPFMQPEGGESVNDVDLMRLQILIC